MKRVTLPITPEILRIRDHLKQETGIDMTYVQVIDHIAHAYLDRQHPEEKEMPKPITPEFFTAEHAVAMTIRDYFAAKAMQAYWSDPNVAPEHDAAAAWSYEMADAMMAARES